MLPPRRSQRTTKRVVYTGLFEERKTKHKLRSPKQTRKPKAAINEPPVKRQRVSAPKKPRSNLSHKKNAGQQRPQQPIINKDVNINEYLEL